MIFWQGANGAYILGYNCGYSKNNIWDGSNSKIFAWCIVDILHSNQYSTTDLMLE